MESSAAPDAVAALIAAWRRRNTPAQPSIRWPRTRWLTGLPEHAATLRALPDELGRDAVRAA